MPGEAARRGKPWRAPHEDSGRGRSSPSGRRSALRSWRKGMRGGGSRESTRTALPLALERVGEVPLPPYIRRPPGDPETDRDAERYQTVFAARPGSVAAPTAGLHFDEEMLDEVRGMGAGIATVTLSVGYGTFSPIRTEEVEAYEIHLEPYRLSPETAAAVAAARERGGRVIAVGTTSVRTLETCARGDGRVDPAEGTTRKFIYPGYRFRVVDAMITNFHLPRSTLLALVMAFGGMERIREAYRCAVEHRYRFFSYGDAMFIS
jgi:S-adenosylmethionine:tRNA ribosyltransferase-isomerase